MFIISEPHSSVFGALTEAFCLIAGLGYAHYFTFLAVFTSLSSSPPSPPLNGFPSHGSPPHARLTLTVFARRWRARRARASQRRRRPMETRWKRRVGEIAPHTRRERGRAPHTRREGGRTPHTRREGGRAGDCSKAKNYGAAECVLHTHVLEFCLCQGPPHPPFTGHSASAHRKQQPC